MFGSLFAETEQLFAHCKVATWGFYKQYLMAEGQSIEEVMDNINGYLEFLDLLANQCESQGLQMYEFPPNDPDLNLWEDTLSHFKYKPDCALPKIVLFHVLECLKWKRIYKLPKYVSSEIENLPKLKIKTRKEASTANSLKELLMMSTKTQMQAAETSTNISVLAKSNKPIVFTQHPLFSAQNLARPTRKFQFPTELSSETSKKFWY